MNTTGSRSGDFHPIGAHAGRTTKHAPDRFQRPVMIVLWHIEKYQNGLMLRYNGL